MVSGALSDFWCPIPHTGLICPALIHGGCLVLLQLDMSCIVGIHGRPVLSQTEKEEYIGGVEIVEGVGRGTDRREGRENWGWDVK